MEGSSVAAASVVAAAIRTIDNERYSSISNCGRDHIPAVFFCAGFISRPSTDEERRAINKCIDASPGELLALTFKARVGRGWCSRGLG